MFFRKYPGKISLVQLLILTAIVAVMALPAVVAAQNHVLITAQAATVGKEIAVYLPSGVKIFSHVTSGGPTERTPTFICPDPATKRFLVACPGPKTSMTTSTHSVLIFDASNTNNITLVSELHPGLYPFHADLSPDGKFVVALDVSGTVAIIDPATPTTYTLVQAGLDHATFVFPGTASDYDIYVARFGNPGGMDIVDGDTLTTRARHSGLLANPHTGVYSTLTKRVYYGHRGGIEIYGTTGTETDQYLGRIAMDAGRMIPLSEISPDGRYLFGGVHYDGIPGSYFYAVDLTNNNITTVSSVSCKYYAFSPDGKWIVAGDFNKPTAQPDFKVHVINTDPASPNFMTVAAEFSLSSRVGFATAAFSPDSRYAYLGLPNADQVMVIDTQALTAGFWNLLPNAAPRFMRMMPVTVSPPLTEVRDWALYE